MNIVDILVLAVLVFSVLAGMYKGFIASGLSTAGFVGSWFGAKALAPRIANLALSNRTLMAVLHQYLEPESFFPSKAQAMTNVAEVVSGGESAIQAAVSSVGGNLSVISSAFESNIRKQAFAKLNIFTLSDYLDQTIWRAVFNVLGFLLAFIVIYAVVKLLVNLLDHVLRFPVLRMFDWLLGGLCGLVRGTAVAVLLLCIVPSVITLISPELMDGLLEGSKLYGIVRQLDFLNIAGVVKNLIG